MPGIGSSPNVEVMLPTHLGGLPIEEAVAALGPLAGLALSWWLATVSGLATRARGRAQPHRKEQER